MIHCNTDLHVDVIDWYFILKNIYLIFIIFNISVNSTTSSTSTKYDPDLLKSDVHHARARVQRLKRELANINSDVDFKQRGVETLQQ